MPNSTVLLFGPPSLPKTASPIMDDFDETASAIIGRPDLSKGFVMTTSTLYDRDFYAWTQQQAQLLRAGQISLLDVEHLAEEIEEMGGSVHHQLESRLGILLMHLLKWQFQPNFRSRSRQLTVKEQRRKIERLLRKNPSLAVNLEETIGDAYGDAILAAAKETGLSESVFPEGCPYTLAAILKTPNSFRTKP